MNSQTPQLSNSKTARQLPRNISRHHRGGYWVRVRRKYISYQAFTRDLAHAIRLRDQFLATGGQVFRHKTYSPKKGRSNTGHIGISEWIKWVRYHPRYCFSAQLERHGRRRRKLFFYGPRSRSRTTALQQALAYHAGLLSSLQAENRIGSPTMMRSLSAVSAPVHVMAGSTPGRRRIVGADSLEGKNMPASIVNRKS